MKADIELNEPSEPPDLSSFPTTIVAPRALRTVSLVSLIMAVGMLGWVALTALRFEVFEKLFNDFDTTLPDITILALRIGPGGFMAICGLLITGLVIKECLLRDKGVALLINVGAMAVAMGMWFFLAQAMFMPMIKLIENVQG